VLKRWGMRKKKKTHSQDKLAPRCTAGGYIKKKFSKGYTLMVYTVVQYLYEDVDL